LIVPFCAWMGVQILDSVMIPMATQQP